MFKENLNHKMFAFEFWNIYTISCFYCGGEIGQGVFYISKLYNYNLLNTFSGKLALYKTKKLCTRFLKYIAMYFNNVFFL